MFFCVWFISPKHTVFKVHLCCHMYQDFISKKRQTFTWKESEFWSVFFLFAAFALWSLLTLLRGKRRSLILTSFAPFTVFWALRSFPHCPRILKTFWILFLSFFQIVWYYSCLKTKGLDSYMEALMVSPKAFWGGENRGHSLPWRLLVTFLQLNYMGGVPCAGNGHLTQPVITTPPFYYLYSTLWT